MAISELLEELNELVEAGMRRLERQGRLTHQMWSPHGVYGTHHSAERAEYGQRLTPKERYKLASHQKRLGRIKAAHRGRKQEKPTQTKILKKAGLRTRPKFKRAGVRGKRRLPK
jgi:hypothetical protein